MNISFLAFGEPFPNYHASYVHISEKMGAVSGLGHRVNIFARPVDNDSGMIGKKFADRKNYKVTYVIFPKYKKIQNPLHFRRSREVVLKGSLDADLFHERYYSEFYSTSIVKELKKPYIIEMNNPVAEEISNPLLRRLVAHVRDKKLAACDAVITQTATLKNIISGFTDKPVHVVPNGVNNSYFSGKSDFLRRTQHIGKNDKIITFVGAFRPWHGINQVSEIVERVVEQNPDVKFVFVGGSEIKMRRFSEKVILIPQLKYPDVVKCLLSSDILIAPFDTSRYSYLEKHGFWWSPVKLYEYMAAGKPIVSYDYKEVRNIVGNAGLLAKPFDTEGFSKNILKLAESESVRRKLGKNAKRLAAGYDWKIRAKQTVKVYESII